MIVGTEKVSREADGPVNGTGGKVVARGAPQTCEPVRSPKIINDSISEDSPQEKMMVTLAESGHPVFRTTSPLSTGQLKSKGSGKLSIQYCADQDTITTVFRTITSVNQLSLYGAVAEMCEERI